MAQARVQVH